MSDSVWWRSSVELLWFSLVTFMCWTVVIQFAGVHVLNCCDSVCWHSVLNCCDSVCWHSCVKLFWFALVTFILNCSDSHADVFRWNWFIFLICIYGTVVGQFSLLTLMCRTVVIRPADVDVHNCCNSACWRLWTTSMMCGAWVTAPCWSRSFKVKMGSRTSSCPTTRGRLTDICCVFWSATTSTCAKCPHLVVSLDAVDKWGGG